MLNTVNYFFSIYFIKYPLDFLPDVYLYVVRDRLNLHPLELVLEYRKDAFDWIEVWRVSWTEHILNREFFQPFHDVVAAVNIQVVH